MFGHNKLLEKPLYQLKTIIERNIYEVSRPGRNSFHISAGTEQFSYGIDGPFLRTIVKNAKGSFLSKNSSINI